MKKKENPINVTESEYPLNIKDITKEDCAKILHKALASSKKYFSIPQLAKAIGISRQSVGDYFYARHKPTQKKWDLLIKHLSIKDENKINTQVTKSVKIEHTEAILSAEKVKSLLFLVEDELEYFMKSSKENRIILKELLPGPTVGYITSLLSALYDEDQLAIFKAFSENK